MLTVRTGFERSRRLTRPLVLCGLAWLAPAVFVSWGSLLAVGHSVTTGDGLEPVLGSTGELDRFGGWKAKRFDATGFFRTQYDGRRWWLVTPEGHEELTAHIPKQLPDVERACAR